MGSFLKDNLTAKLTVFIIIVGFVINVSFILTKESNEAYSEPVLDKGLIQSPINIVTNKAIAAKHHIVPNYNPTHEEIIHKKNTIEVEYDEGSYVLFDSVQYSIRQFHFHTPSEHLVDGVTYPMELHLVHTNKDDTTDAIQYFVISVLFKMGKENGFIKYLEEDIPYKVGEKIENDDAYLNIADLISLELTDYYHYSGSLTTPPYTETVHWAVLEHILEASPEQISRINKLEGNNARHIQSVNGRMIEITHDLPAIN